MQPVSLTKICKVIAFGFYFDKINFSTVFINEKTQELWIVVDSLFFIAGLSRIVNQSYQVVVC